MRTSKFVDIVSCSMRMYFTRKHPKPTWRIAVSRTLYRYTFPSSVDFMEVEAAMLLALFGTQSLHGETQVRLDAAHTIDRESRVCLLDATTPIGLDLNRLFLGFIRREVGDESIRVERLIGQRRNAVDATAV